MEALESAIASRASRALSLPSTNMALGRKLVAAGLSTSSQTAFDDALQQYGQVDRATRTELFERIRQHARDAAAAKRAAAEQATASFTTAAPPPTERLEDPLTGLPAQGGLLIRAGQSRHAFAPREGGSRLGLDKLAAQKARERGMAPPPPPASKRPRLSHLEGDGEEGGGDDDDAARAARRYRKPREPTPSHGGGVNAEAAARIKDRVQQRLKGDGQTFTTRGGADAPGGGGGSSANPSGGGALRSVRAGEPPSPSPSVGSSAEWEAPSPIHPSFDGRHFDSEPRGIVTDTPARTPLDSVPARSHISATPQPSPQIHGGGERYQLGALGSTGAEREGGGGGGGGGGEAEAGVEAEAEADDALEREWYEQEEGAHSVDSTHDPFLGDAKLYEKREEHLRKRVNHRAMARRNDQNRWEESRLGASGVVRMMGDGDDDDDNELKTHVVVHDMKPPFLDGRVVFSEQSQPVVPVKDPTSDMAQLAKKGSQLIRTAREKRERERAHKEQFKMSGTTLGKIMGVKDDEKVEVVGDGKGQAEYQDDAFSSKPKGDGDGDGGDGDGDDGGDQTGKKDATFAEHLKGGKEQAASEFAMTKTIDEQRRFLPIWGCRSALLTVMRDNNVVILVGETGSGKTTQIAQYLHEDGLTAFGMVGCTQPRRVAAMSVAKRVSEEMGVELGKEVGYAIRFEDMTGPETILKYMTDGVLLRETLTEPDLDRYACVIMDEAHERGLNTDVLFGLLKKVAARRRDFKLIVTSATMDAGKFSDFFGNVPIFKIPGRTFPVDILYAKTPCEDYVEAAVKQCIQIHLSQPAGDVLIFMTGQEDILATCTVIQERLDELDEKELPPILILPVYSLLPSELQAKIFDKAEGGARKVIVATNIAETSLTVDGIRYVIDGGTMGRDSDRAPHTRSTPLTPLLLPPQASAS